MNTIDYADRFDTNLSEAQWQTLIDLPCRMISYGLGEPFAPSAAPARRGDSIAAEYNAALRWRVGHQLFFVVIQALGVSVSCALAAAVCKKRQTRCSSPVSVRAPRQHR